MQNKFILPFCEWSICWTSNDGDDVALVPIRPTEDTATSEVARGASSLLCIKKSYT